MDLNIFKRFSFFSKKEEAIKKAIELNNLIFLEKVLEESSYTAKQRVIILEAILSKKLSMWMLPNKYFLKRNHSKKEISLLLKIFANNKLKIVYHHVNALKIIRHYKEIDKKETEEIRKIVSGISISRGDIHGRDVGVYTRSVLLDICSLPSCFDDCKAKFLTATLKQKLIRTPKIRLGKIADITLIDLYNKGMIEDCLFISYFSKVYLEQSIEKPLFDINTGFGGLEQEVASCVLNKVNNGVVTRKDAHFIILLARKIIGSRLKKHFREAIEQFKDSKNSYLSDLYLSYISR